MVARVFDERTRTWSDGRAVNITHLQRSRYAGTPAGVAAHEWCASPDDADADAEVVVGEARLQPAGDGFHIAPASPAPVGAAARGAAGDDDAPPVVSASLPAMYALYRGNAFRRGGAGLQKMLKKTEHHRRGKGRG
eukprot:gene6892-21521_t